MIYYLMKSSHLVRSCARRLVAKLIHGHIFGKEISGDRSSVADVISFALSEVCREEFLVDESIAREGDLTTTTTDETRSESFQLTLIQRTLMKVADSI